MAGRAALGARRVAVMVGREGRLRRRRGLDFGRDRDRDRDRDVQRPDRRVLPPRRGEFPASRGPGVVGVMVLADAVGKVVVGALVSVRCLVHAARPLRRGEGDTTKGLK